MGQDHIEQLDGLADSTEASLACALDLFAVADVLREQVALRRAMTDPTLPVQSREQLLSTLFEGKLGPAALDFCRQAVAQDWSSGLQLADSVERQATRIALKSTDPRRVQAELNTVREAIIANDKLRAAFGRHAATDEAKSVLVRDLISGRADEVTTALVTRASRQGSGVLHELDMQLDLTSQVQGRRLARATVAQKLPEDQADRLVQQLSRLFGAVDVIQHVDPRILGGIKVQVDDELIDGSVSAKVSQAARGIG